MATSPFDLFSIYFKLILFCVGSLRIGGIFFDHNVFGLSQSILSHYLPIFLDFSGVTNKEKKEVASKGSKNRIFPNLLPFSLSNLIDKTKAQKKEGKDKAAKADDPKAGADVGKIVNLIAGDSIRVRNIICFSPSFFF